MCGHIVGINSMPMQCGVHVECVGSVADTYCAVPHTIDSRIEVLLP